MAVNGSLKEVSRLTAMVVVWFITVLVVGIAAREETGETPLQIDACAIAEQSSTNMVTIVASSRSTTATTGSVIFQFTSCTIRKGMKINVAIPITGGSTFIEISNTTMQGGSLDIVPTAGSSFVEDVHVSVKNATLRADGDLLVVKTRAGCRNVTMQMEDVVMTSDEGSVASIIGSNEGNTMTNVSIHVGGNSLLRAKRLAASVETSKLVDSCLVADTALDGGCGVGPVNITAGGASVNEHVGVLSILPTQQVLAILSLENTHIAVVHAPPSACDSEPLLITPPPSIFMVSEVNLGIAATASIALRHERHAELRLTGNVSIDIKLLSRSAPTLPPPSSSPSMNPQETIQMEGALLKLTSIAGMNERRRIGHLTLGVVGGITLSTSSSMFPGNTQLHLNQCTLRLLFQSTNTSTSESAELSVKSVGTAASVLGIGLHSYAMRHLPSILLDITSDSNVVIASILSRNKGAISIGTTSGDVNTVVGAVLGIAVCSYSKDATALSFVVSERSSLAIFISATGCRHINLRSASPSAGTVLGIAVYSRSEGGTTASFKVEKSSTLSITSSVVACGDVSMNSIANRWGASATLGVAAYLLRYRGDGGIIATFTVQDQSNFQIVSSAKHTDTLHMISTQADNAASAIVGVAFTASSNPTTINTLVSGKSHFAIASSASDCKQITFTSNVQGLASSAVLGFCMYSYSKDGSASGKFNVERGSSASIDASIASTEKFTLSSIAGGGSYVASTAIGVALGAFPGKSEMKVDVSSTFRINALLTKNNGHTSSGDSTPSVSSSVSVHPENANSAIGIMANGGFTALSYTNTELTLCGDGHVKLTAPNGPLVGTQPLITTVNPKKTNYWTPTDASPSWCVRKATLCEDIVNSTLRQTHLPHHTLTTGSCRPVVFQVGPPPEENVTSTQSLLPTPTLSAQQVTSNTTSPSLTTTDSATMPTPSATTSVTPSPTMTNTTAPPTQPTESPPTSPPHTRPPPKQRTVKITTSVLMPDNEQAATVVLSTAGASGAVGSTLGSGGGGMVVTAGSSVRMMECGLADDDPRPASFELPIQFAVGSGSTRYFAGASLAHTLLQCFFLAVPVLLRRVSTSGSRGSRNAVMYLSMLFCGAHAFFTPAILGACSTVLNNDDDGLSLAVAGCCVLVLVGVHGAVVLAVHRGPQNGLVARAVEGLKPHSAKFKFSVRSGSSGSRSSTTTSSSSSGSNSDSESSGSDDDDDTTALSRTASAGKSSGQRSTSFLFSGHATKDILLTLFDGCRIFEKASHRHYASIETTLYSIIAVISGARPKENCTAAVFVIGVLAIAQLLYIVVIRPFRTRLDTIFSLLNALVLVVLSLAVAVSVQKRSSEDAVPDEWVLKTVEACLWLISVLGFTQLFVQGYWAFHLGQRRKHREELRELEAVNVTDATAIDAAGTLHDDVDGAFSQPLLKVGLYGADDVSPAEADSNVLLSDASRSSNSSFASDCSSSSSVDSSTLQNPLAQE